MKDNDYSKARTDEYGYDTDEGELNAEEGSVEEVPSAMSRSIEQSVEVMTLGEDDDEDNDDGDVQRRSIDAAEALEEEEEDSDVSSEVSVNSSSRRMSGSESGGGSVSDQSLLETEEEEEEEGRDLYNAVRNEDWDTARKLLVTSNAQVFFEYTSPDRHNALHSACIRDAPSDIVQSMLNASATAPLQQHDLGCTPLHHAIYSSSEEVIIMLLEACPRAALIANINGYTPLHTAMTIRSSNDTHRLHVIRHLLTANLAAAKTTNDDGDTPLHLLFRIWNVPLGNTLDSINGHSKTIQDVILRGKGYHMKIGDLYQTSLLLLQAAIHGSIKDNPDSLFRPLCAAINYPHCPLSLVNLILRMDPMQASQWDREENLPIHVAAASTSFCDSIFWTKSDDKIPTVIKNLLKTNPKFAQIPDGKDRLPLHIAIRSEKSFNNGLEAILRAAPKGLNTRSIKTHLYPFLHAAVEHGRAKNKLQKFTTCFMLLMQNPHFVSSGIPH